MKEFAISPLAFYLVLSFALSIDSFLLSLLFGLKKERSRKEELTLVISFTVVQGIFLSFGHLMMKKLLVLIGSWTSFLPLGIFLFLAFKSLKDAFGQGEAGDFFSRGHFGVKNSLLLSVLASFDALEVGVSITNSSFFWPGLFLVMAITLITSFVGIKVGKMLSWQRPQRLHLLSFVFYLLLAFHSLYE